MKKYPIALFLLLAGSAAHLSAGEAITVTLAGEEELTISGDQFRAFMALIDPETAEQLKAQREAYMKSLSEEELKELEQKAVFPFPSAEKKAFDFVINNSNSFTNKNSKAINAALDELYSSEDPTTLVALLKLADYLASQQVLNPVAEYLISKADDMIKHKPELLKAILETLKKQKALRNVFPIDAPITWRNESMLIRAIFYNRNEIAKELIELGAKLDLQDTIGVTALIAAAKKGKKK